MIASSKSIIKGVVMTLTVIALPTQAIAQQRVTCESASQLWREQYTTVQQYDATANACMSHFDAINRPSDIDRRTRETAEATAALENLEREYAARDEFVPEWIRVKHRPYYYACRDQLPDAYFIALDRRSELQSLIQSSDCVRPWKYDGTPN